MLRGKEEAQAQTKEHLRTIGYKNTEIELLKEETRRLEAQLSTLEAKHAEAMRAEDKVRIGELERQLKWRCEQNAMLERQIQELKRPSDRNGAYDALFEVAKRMGQVTRHTDGGALLELQERIKSLVTLSVAGNGCSAKELGELQRAVVNPLVAVYTKAYAREEDSAMARRMGEAAKRKR